VPCPATETGKDPSIDTIRAAAVRDRPAATTRPLDLAGLEAAALAGARAPAAFLHRARCNAAARMGEYVEAMEHRVAA
jgi:hypothetical protein